MALAATTGPETLLPSLADERWLDSPSTEHLLLSLLGDIEVVALLRGCGASEGALGDALRAHLATHGKPSPRRFAGVSSLWKRDRPRTDPLVERVLARSIIRAKASDRRRVSSAHLLITLIDESDGAASGFLRRQGVTRYHALNYLSHRIVQGTDAPMPPKPASPWVLCGVVMQNDDYTPMEFVVHVLETVFDKSREDAVRSTQQIHETGSAECGVFAYDAALAKVKAATDLSRSHEHALRCVLAVKTTEREGANAELLT